jgi:protein-export membrane protein SecD
MHKYRIGSIALLIALLGLSYFLVSSERPDARFPFRFGLDLIGGTELVYEADVSEIAPQDVGGAMETLREVIERRVNIFGVSEPLIQIEEAGIFSGNREHRLLVELPGVTDIDEAVALIGQTPLLEFRLEKEGIRDLVNDSGVNASTTLDDLFIETGLSGRLLERSSLQFDPNSGQPIVMLEFNEEGKNLFAEITGANLGKVLAITLDGELIQTPIIQDAITDGVAQITGSFTPEEAREVVRQLNYGALPVPIELVRTESVGASLGDAALVAGVRAGIIGFVLLSLFMVLWYRLPGVVSVVALVLYVVLSLSIFKLIPVTLTAAGLAGFILSIGMAVDANVLIFERMKEELRKGSSLDDAMKEGFARAWLSIRDSNVSSIITAIVLFWLGTSAVKGFALTLGVGVFVSMFTAITASRTLLYATLMKESPLVRFLFSSGFHR